MGEEYLHGVRMMDIKSEFSSVYSERYYLTQLSLTKHFHYFVYK